MKNSTRISIGVAIALAIMTPSYAADWVKPNAKLTPGITNPAVTQANIKENICKSGWTDTVRPTTTYTNKLKATQLTTTYKFLVATYGADLSGYEEDHLISLQLGGSPSDPKNLWPQPYVGANARKKDVVETKLKRMICAGTITLKDAQKAISKDWVAAYNKYSVPADAKVVESNG
jgi:opacity protein-like surface antigen